MNSVPQPPPQSVVTTRLPVGLAGFALLVLVWAYNWIVTKNALHYVGAFDFAAHRSAIGALTLFAILLFSRQSLLPPPLLPTLALGLLQTSGFTLLMNLALINGGAGKVAVLAYTMPFWTLFWAWLVLNERILGGQWLAIGLAFAGMWAIVDPLQLHGTLLGKLLAVGAGLIWAAATVYAKWLRPRMRSGALSLTAWQMALGTLPLYLVAWVVPQAPPQPRPYFWFALLYAGVLASGLGWWMWMRVLQRVPAGTASLNALAIPLVAVCAAWIEHGERPAASELTGMLLVAMALGLLSWLTARRQCNQQ
ncbi:MAG: EamA family transporter [Chitinivorax sp.]